MTTSSCEVPGCDRLAAGATICGGCLGRLTRALGDVPALARELEVAITRQARVTDPGERRPGGKTPLVFHYAASEACWVLRNTLVGWVRELADDGESWPADVIAGISRWLGARTGRIRIHPAGGEAVDEITSAVGAAWRAVDHPPDRVYAGPCPRCGTDCYAPLGAASATCRGCRTPLDVAEARTWMLAQLDDHLFTAHEMTRVLARVGVVLTDERMRQIARRNLQPRGHDHRGRKLYRLGDVHDWIARHGRAIVPADACA